MKLMDKPKQSISRIGKYDSQTNLTSLGTAEQKNEEYME